MLAVSAQCFAQCKAVGCAKKCMPRQRCCRAQSGMCQHPSLALPAAWAWNALRRIIAYDSAAPDCLLRPARVCRGVFITYNVLQAALPWLVPSQPAAEEFLHSQVCLPAWRITGKSGCAR